MSTLTEMSLNANAIIEGRNIAGRGSIPAGNLNYDSLHSLQSMGIKWMKGKDKRLVSW